MGGSVSQPVVRIELMGWRQPLINGHEVIRVLPPPSDTEVVSARRSVRRGRRRVLPAVGCSEGR